MSGHKSIVFLFCCFLFFSKVLQAAVCDNPKEPESTRIYFANGMSNSNEKAWDNREKLREQLGLHGLQGVDFGLSYNDNENWLAQLLEVYRQRKNESDEFWYWLRRMDEAPQWFHDAYVEKVGRLNDQMVQGDSDLVRHIMQYLADLKSGKKVVIVGHSQGNFYANNAYRHIRTNYPEYRNSIGIVSVATPSNWVEGGGSYQINNVYTTNPEDLVINLVRRFYTDTLVANAPAYDNPTSMTDHEFSETYLKRYPARIAGQVHARITSLVQPPMAFDCKDPGEIPVRVNTTSAASISSTSARLYGFVQSGKNIAAHCIWRPTASGNPPSCWSQRSKIPKSGSLDTGRSFYCTAANLTPNTSYSYRVCGREGNRISDGGVTGFKTNISCGTPLQANGGSEGLSVNYGMGDKSGNVLLEFQAYTIPDKLEIWQGGKKIYTTGGYVSGHRSVSLFHNPAKGQEWTIKVYGNSNTRTAWVLNISCPSS